MPRHGIRHHHIGHHHSSVHRSHRTRPVQYSSIESYANANDMSIQSKLGVEAIFLSSSSASSAQYDNIAISKKSVLFYNAGTTIGTPLKFNLPSIYEFTLYGDEGTLATFEQNHHPIFSIHGSKKRLDSIKNELEKYSNKIKQTSICQDCESEATQTCPCCMNLNKVGDEVSAACSSHITNKFVTGLVDRKKFSCPKCGSNICYKCVEEKGLFTKQYYCKFCHSELSYEKLSFF